MIQHTVIITETLQHTILVNAPDTKMAYLIAQAQRAQMDYNNATRAFDKEDGVTVHYIETTGYEIEVN
jgi:hypothetical protein